MVDLGEGKNSTSNTKSIQIKAILEQYQQTKQNNFKFLVKMLSLILTEFGKGMKILFIVTFTPQKRMWDRIRSRNHLKDNILLVIFI